jgi:hypothetical protein
MKETSAQFSAEATSSIRAALDAALDARRKFDQFDHRVQEGLASVVESFAKLAAESPREVFGLSAATSAKDHAVAAGSSNPAQLVTIIEVVLRHIEAEKRFIRETIEDAARLLVQIIQASADAAKSLITQVVTLLDGVKDMLIVLIDKLAALPPETLQLVKEALAEMLGNVVTSTNQLVTNTIDALHRA